MVINRNRKRGEDLQKILEEMEVGDSPVFDEVTAWDITRVPGGFIYKNEYAGAVFVAYEPKAKAGRPPKLEEKKIEKPIDTKKVVQK